MSSLSADVAYLLGRLGHLNYELWIHVYTINPYSRFVAIKLMASTSKRRKKTRLIDGLVVTLGGA